MKNILTLAMFLGLMLGGQTSSAKSLSQNNGISCRGQDLKNFQVDLSPADGNGDRVLRLSNWPTTVGTISHDHLKEYVRECVNESVYLWCDGAGIYDNGPAYTGHFQLNLNTMKVTIGNQNHNLICD